VRLDHCHARADVLTLDQRGVPNPDPGDIGDRVPFAGRQGADGDAELPRPGATVSDQADASSGTTVIVRITPRGSLPTSLGSFNTLAQALLGCGNGSMGAILALPVPE
jgi:hypothetical protein